MKAIVERSISLTYCLTSSLAIVHSCRWPSEDLELRSKDVVCNSPFQGGGRAGEATVAFCDEQYG